MKKMLLNVIRQKGAYAYSYGNPFINMLVNWKDTPEKTVCALRCRGKCVGGSANLAGKKVPCNLLKVEPTLLCVLLRF